MHPVWLVAIALLVGGGVPALVLARRAGREAERTSRAIRRLSEELGAGARALGSEVGRLEARVETTREHGRGLLDEIRPRQRPPRRRR